MHQGWVGTHFLPSSLLLTLGLRLLKLFRLRLRRLVPRGYIHKVAGGSCTGAAARHYSRSRRFPKLGRIGDAGIVGDRSFRQLQFLVQPGARPASRHCPATQGNPRGGGKGADVPLLCPETKRNRVPNLAVSA